MNTNCKGQTLSSCLLSSLPLTKDWLFYATLLVSKMILHTFGFTWQIKFELQHLFAECFNKDNAQKYPCIVVLSFTYNSYNTYDNNTYLKLYIPTVLSNHFKLMCSGGQWVYFKFHRLWPGYNHELWRPFKCKVSL